MDSLGWGLGLIAVFLFYWLIVPAISELLDRYALWLGIAAVVLVGLWLLSYGGFLGGVGIFVLVVGGGAIFLSTRSIKFRD